MRSKARGEAIAITTERGSFQAFRSSTVPSTRPYSFSVPAATPSSKKPIKFQEGDFPLIARRQQAVSLPNPPAPMIAIFFFIFRNP